MLYDADFNLTQFTNLLLCGMRWYDPNTGRWLSRDPIGYDGGDNLYGYCGGDPVNEADPSGLAPGDDGNDPGAYLGNIFDQATPSDWWNSLTNNDVTRAIGVLANAASWIPLPENP